MLPGLRASLLGAFSLPLLAACGAGSYSSISGAAPAAAAAAVTPTRATGFVTGSASLGSDDTVTATPSIGGTVAVVVGARRTLSIAFTSVDGRPITAFGISGSLGALPAGWSGPGSFVCPSLNAGSGCVLNLTYAPQVLDSGTFTLDYIFVDNATVPRTTYSITIAYVATPSNNVVAAASPSGQVTAVLGDASAVSVNFTTDDGNAATALALTADASVLPPGWSTAVPDFSCAIVSTGNGCQLALRYQPTLAARGTLSLNYGYTDYSGAAKVGTLNIPYATATQGSVVATTSPMAQVTAVQKSGGQALAVTFDTNDGKAASGLSVTSALTSLPDGWSSAVDSFSCVSVSTGNGCQLRMNYAPPALASGTLSLSYAYTDSSGAAQTGTLNVAYAATTDDNVAAMASPSGQINAVVGKASQAVAVTFATDDGRPATALQLTSALSALPAGWSASQSTFGCAGLNGGGGCQLQLAYAPIAADSGSLTLGYSYQNDAGAARTGTLSIPYRATTDDNVVGTPSQSALVVRTGSTSPVSVDFTTDDGNPASALTVTAGLDALPAGWSSTAGTLTCQSIITGSTCRLTLAYAPTVPGGGTLTFGFGYSNDSGYAKTGTVSIMYGAVDPYLYVVDSSSSSLSACAINADGTLLPCNPVGSGFAAPVGLALDRSFAYVTNGTFVTRCRLADSGALANCAATGPSLVAAGNLSVDPSAAFAYVEQAGGLEVCTIAAADGSLSGCAVTAPLVGLAFAPDGAHVYGVNTVTSVVDVCIPAGDGTLTHCVDAGSGVAQPKTVLAVANGNLYVASTSGAVTLCIVATDAGLGGCQPTAAGVPVSGLALNGIVAYVTDPVAGVAACAVGTTGLLANCAAVADPSFNGVRGVSVQ